MKPKLILEFSKMNGAGNDFIVLDNRFYHFSLAELADLARRFCPRRFGIGADGLLALAPADEPAHAYRMLYLNADGSVGTMCGNGARCLARFAQNAGFSSDTLVFESHAGLYRAEVQADEAVRLYVPAAQRFTDSVEVETPYPNPVHFIWTGTEHAVTFVDHVADFPVVDWGPKLRHDPAFSPEGVNVNFVEVVDDQTVQMRTFEKGVEAETWACGTGALAAAVVARRLGYLHTPEIAVAMRGGTVVIGLDEHAGEMTMTGPAAFVYRGTVEV